MNYSGNGSVDFLPQWTQSATDEWLKFLTKYLCHLLNICGIVKSPIYARRKCPWGASCRSNFLLSHPVAFYEGINACYLEANPLVRGKITAYR